MRKLILAISSLTCGLFVIADAEPVCHKCEVIREYNRTHKESDFTYYEDYLKDKEEKTKQNSTQNPPKEEKAPETQK
jgi:hypothetical protein